MDNSRLRNLLDDYALRINQLSEDRDDLQRRLYATLNSRSWRLTAPLRAAVSTLKAFRGGLKIKASRPTQSIVQPRSDWTRDEVTLDASPIQPAASKFGYFGSQPLNADEVYPGRSTLAQFVNNSASLGPPIRLPAIRIDPLHWRLGSGDRLHGAVALQERNNIRSYDTIGSLIFISEASDGSCGLDRTAASIAALCKGVSAYKTEQIRWFIVDRRDTEAVRSFVKEIQAALPSDVLVEAGGQINSLLKALSAVEGAWIVPLGADMEVSDDVFDILSHYVKAFPRGRMIRFPVVERVQDNLFYCGEVRHFSGSRTIEDTFSESASALRVDCFSTRQELLDDKMAALTSVAIQVALCESTLSIHEPLLMKNGGTAEPDDRAKALREISRLTRRHLASVPRSPIFKRAMRDQPIGLCIVRTQGQRMELLREAVESIASQVYETVPCVVSHGPEGVSDNVRNFLQGSTPIVSLSASDIRKKRGYPCNVGLSYLRDHSDEYDFLCFLDDDDFLYPNFSERLVDALQRTDADIAFGSSNAVSEAGAIQMLHAALPAICLTAGNFIPINAFAVRVDTVLKTAAEFDESLDFVEDWDFLLTLMARGARFVPIFETVSAYRVRDKDKTVDLECHRSSYDLVLKRARKLGKSFGEKDFWRDILDFPPEQSQLLGPGQMSHLRETLALMRSGE